MIYARYQSPDVAKRIMEINERIRVGGVQNITDDDIEFYNQHAMSKDTGWQGMTGAMGATPLGRKINAVNSLVQAARGGAAAGGAGALSAL